MFLLACPRDHAGAREIAMLGPIFFNYLSICLGVGLGFGLVVMGCVWGSA